MSILEFKLENFNGDGKKEDMRKAFLILYHIYQEILINDNQWHFFYEGTYSFLRCGIDYKNMVKRLLDKNNIKYNWPIKEWEEPFELTRNMQEQFSIVFHSLSVLVMELHSHYDMGNNHKLTEYTADRVIHPFLNMATYLQYLKGTNISPYWESQIMANLSIFRSYNMGIIDGGKLVQKIVKEKISNGE